ncbi:serine hydrolase [Psychroserpens sp. SPM9]|uniref:serine hydrolase n=1 Tax=Psychroserpens sp. SPM9 TaxID=2975598 RepID=UPI0021A25E43|nr:serine hydrolase [Psychroserpens sp. SPM9]MDG5491499.1 serine hydrolase [Psychroserpens sp. SPM9]
MKRNHIYFSVALIALLCSCQQNTSNEAASNITTIIVSPEGERIDSLLTPYVKTLRSLTDNTAGLAIGITKGNRIIYARTFGYENIAEKTEADFNTLFHIASVSKPFTAAAIVKLIQQKKLNLEDKIVDHIPEFKMKGEAYKHITIQHILNHTSGIPRHVSENNWLNPKPLEANLDFVKDFELDFEPGSQFNYSNSAFDILGIVISRASGLSYADYVTTHILKPAGMTQSTFIKPKNTLPPHWAVPYSYGLETQEWTPFPHAENYLPSSGLQTTLLDMCQWGMLHANQGSLNGKHVIENSYFKLLTTPTYETPWGNTIGLSWFLQSYLERPIIMHTGSDTGFEAIMYIYPNEDISIIVMANRDFARTGRIINAASEIIYNQTPKTYQVSAKYKFAETYKAHGITRAITEWNELKKDTTDIYNVDDDAILTTGAILENGKQWKATKEILDYYTSLNDQSTYAWRLLGNANLNLKDTTAAIQCYQKTLDINPDYTKGKIALESLLKTKSTTQ